MNKEKFFKPFQDSLSNRHNIPNLNKPETEKFGLYNKKRTPASIYNVLTAHLMKKGKRSIAEKIIRKCVGFIKAKEEKESMAYAMRSIKKIRPLIGPSETVGAKRIIPITPKKSQKLAIQWVIQGAQKNHIEKGMALCLYLELCKTHTKQGYAIKKNEELLNAATAGKK